jgi:pyruvate-ferredoxin/flavodoxin oxidoreductase
MNTGMQEHKAAVDSGAWPLYRYHPARTEKGESPLQLDSKGPKMPLKNYYDRQNRFRLLGSTRPQQAQLLLEQAQQEIHSRWKLYQQMAETTPNQGEN